MADLSKKRKPRTRFLVTRVNDAEHAKIVGEAKRRKMGHSTFMRTVALKAIPARLAA